MEHLMSKPLLNFRPKPEVAEMIKVMAAEDRRPVSQFLSILVEDAIAKRSNEQRNAA
jgi:hypothetical protein